MKMKGYKNICNNINLLYFIFLISILNIIWFVYYNKRCILIFVCCCLAIYIINKNMIFVLGISLILVDSLYLLNLVKKEGFVGDEIVENYENDVSNNSSKKKNENDENFQNDENDENDENFENDASNNLLKTKGETKGENETFTNIINGISDEESDEETNYMHDKSIIKKMKQLNPIILDTLKNMNSVHIKELNDSINHLTDKIDP